MLKDSGTSSFPSGKVSHRSGKSLLTYTIIVYSEAWNIHTPHHDSFNSILGTGSTHPTALVSQSSEDYRYAPLPTWQLLNTLDINSFSKVFSKQENVHTMSMSVKYLVFLSIGFLWRLLMTDTKLHGKGMHRPHEIPGLECFQWGKKKLMAPSQWRLRTLPMVHFSTNHI